MSPKKTNIWWYVLIYHQADNLRILESWGTIRCVHHFCAHGNVGHHSLEWGGVWILGNYPKIKQKHFHTHTLFKLQHTPKKKTFNTPTTEVLFVPNTKITPTAKPKNGWFPPAHRAQLHWLVTTQNLPQKSPPRHQSVVASHVKISSFRRVQTSVGEMFWWRIHGTGRYIYLHGWLIFVRKCMVNQTTHRSYGVDSVDSKHLGGLSREQADPTWVLVKNASSPYLKRQWVHRCHKLVVSQNFIPKSMERSKNCQKRQKVWDRYGDV